MPGQSTHRADDRAEVRGKRVHVNSVAFVGSPATIVPATIVESEKFTRESFEGALDKVSRPIKGKYADVLPSSEEFIRDKRREAELEDRPS